MSLATRELLELANRVTKCEHLIFEGRVYYGHPVHDKDRFPLGKEFSPSLTGEDWQQAQALRVIVAAFNLPGFSTALRYSNGFTIEYWVKPECKETPVCPDILSASIAALLAVGE